VFNLGSAARTDLSMETVTLNGISVVTFIISPCEDGTSRGWNVRLHLLPKQSCISALVDGNSLEIEHIDPVSKDDAFFPFGGKRTAPAHLAGKVAEVFIPSSSDQRMLQFKISE